MEQEVRDLIEGYVAERRAVLDQIEAGWSKQTRRPTAAEIDAWMGMGAPVKIVVDTNVVAYLLLGTEALVDEAKLALHTAANLLAPAHWE
jgi:hypothetical protein